MYRSEEHQISFFDFNQSCGMRLNKDIERYKDRTGHYPARVLVDQIYRNRANRDYCKEHGIRISGPKKDISLQFLPTLAVSTGFADPNYASLHLNFLDTLAYFAKDEADREYNQQFAGAKIV